MIEDKDEINIDITDCYNYETNIIYELNNATYFFQMLCLIMSDSKYIIFSEYTTLVNPISIFMFMPCINTNTEIYKTSKIINTKKDYL